MSGLNPHALKTANPARFIDVPSLGLISASGPDTVNFLQGQLTCDLNQLTADNWLFGGHCDAKGKLWSIFRTVKRENDVVLIQNKSTITQSLAQLQKFSVFSKVDITDKSDEFRCFVVVGENAAEAINSYLGIKPEAEHTRAANLQVLRLMPSVFLCIAAIEADLSEVPDMLPETYWHALQIEQGWPNLSAVHTETFIPQMVNLDTLNGVNFKKGCYIGQETIARTHYKGQNKRRLTRLIGEAESTPVPADLIEIQLGENWRRAGAVISAVRYDNDVIAIQAVLPSDLDTQAKLRIKGQDDSKFTPCPESDETESINE